MKKIIIIALIVVIAASASYLIGTGYIINGGIYLGEYNVSVSFEYNASFQ